MIVYKNYLGYYGIFNQGKTESTRLVSVNKLTYSKNRITCKARDVTSSITIKFDR